MLARDVAAYEAHRAVAGPVFFDRGIPDSVGYLRLEGLPVPPAMLRAAQVHRYARVFICPPWPDIYVTDQERRQTHEVAVRTYEAMVETYGALGYEPIEVPRTTVAERARFVLESIEGGA